MKLAAFAALLACLGVGACFYEVGEPNVTTSGAGANGSSASGSGSHPGCPDGGCPDGTTCDAAEDWCVVAPQSACGTFVFVETPTRLRADTCDGFEIDACGSSRLELTFQLGGAGTWLVAIDGGHASDVSGACIAGQLGCNPTHQLEPGTRFAAHAIDGCGPITIEASAAP
jgi:hypothetical protein